MMAVFQNNLFFSLFVQTNKLFNLEINMEAIYFLVTTTRDHSLAKTKKIFGENFGTNFKYKLYFF